jgi:DNA-binding Lrp family transcriptional regulator
VVTSKTLETHLDDMDYDILGILAKTCRKSYRDIGTALELSPKLVKYRIDKLMEMDIILSFNIKINHRLLGLTQRKVFLTLTMISEATIASITQYLKGLASTVFITKVIGMADLEFELMVKSNEEFYQIMKQIRYAFPNLIRKTPPLLFPRNPASTIFP